MLQYAVNTHRHFNVASTLKCYAITGLSQQMTDLFIYLWFFFFFVVVVVVFFNIRIRLSM